MNSNTAIIVFTRTAHDEALHKHFVKSGNVKANTIIANSLIAHTVATVRQTQIPYFVIYSNQQEGSTFGDRIANAMFDVFNLGFENVIAIGNDCPDLDAALLLKAQKCLDENQIVLGPAIDGGVYLLGLSKAEFNNRLLEIVEWESETMFISLLKYLEGANKLFYCLESKRDVDNTDDLFAVLTRCRPLCRLEAIVRSVLASVKKSLLTYNFSYLSYILKSRFSLRAPPVIA